MRATKLLRVVQTTNRISGSTSSTFRIPRLSAASSRSLSTTVDGSSSTVSEQPLAQERNGKRSAKVRRANELPESISEIEELLDTLSAFQEESRSLDIPPDVDLESLSTLEPHYPRALLPAPVVKPTHGIHVATLHFRCYTPAVSAISLFMHFTTHLLASLNIPHSRPASLPTTTSLWTVPKSPFIHKKTQENYVRRTHRRAIKVWDAEKEVLDLAEELLKREMIPGVGMKVQRYDYKEVGWGRKMGRLGVQDRLKRSLEEVKKLRSAAAAAAPATTATTASTEASTESVQEGAEGSPITPSILVSPTSSTEGTPNTYVDETTRLAQELIEKELSGAAEAEEVDELEIQVLKAENDAAAERRNLEEMLAEKAGEAVESDGVEDRGDTLAHLASPTGEKNTDTPLAEAQEVQKEATEAAEPTPAETGNIDAIAAATEGIQGGGQPSELSKAQQDVVDVVDEVKLEERPKEGVVDDVKVDGEESAAVDGQVPVGEGDKQK